jgi:hypothetical protein
LVIGMSQYRFLQDAYIGRMFPAGTVASTADVPGGLLPAGWQPGPFVDPLDSNAVNDFYNAGPMRPARQWGGGFGPKPVTYWLATPQPTNSSVTLWSLVGLGIGKAPLFTPNGACAVL